ncbi:MAG: hypothetical protein KJ674_05060 [Nanoarchaeota archaeon]|nr:hypothetical protein [Nanoarchaeota archaeon]
MVDLMFQDKEEGIHFFNEIGYEVRYKEGNSCGLVTPLNPPVGYPGNGENKLPNKKNQKKWYHLRKNITNMYKSKSIDYAPIGILYEQGSFRFTYLNRDPIILDLQKSIIESYEKRGLEKIIS